jgi:hypothetical protein
MTTVHLGAGPLPVRPGVGATVFEHACRFGFEGIVSKRLTAPYRCRKISRIPLCAGATRARGEHRGARLNRRNRGRGDLFRPPPCVSLRGASNGGRCWPLLNGTTAILDALAKGGLQIGRTAMLSQHVRKSLIGGPSTISSGIGSIVASTVSNWWTWRCVWVGLCCSLGSYSTSDCRCRNVSGGAREPDRRALVVSPRKRGPA